jgi:hypothetical protein
MGSEMAGGQAGPFGRLPSDRITEPHFEPRTSVELWSTHRGRQQRVKVYAGTHPDEINALIEQAVDAYDRLAATDESLPLRRHRAASR